MAHTRGSRTRTAAKLTRPKYVFAKDPEDLAALADKGLARCKALVDKIAKAKGARTLANTLVPYEDVQRELYELLTQPKFLSDVHPDGGMRDAGDTAYQAAERFQTELNLNRALYDAFAALDMSGEDDETRYAVHKILRDFRLAGVDRDEATRARVRALRDEITAIGQEFDKNIREDERSIALDGPDALEGMPADYIAAHPPGPDGKIKITTSYPDAIPLIRYARRAEVRKRLQREFLDRAYPKNIDVLRKLLERRHELARVLGHAHHADYVTKDKMVGTARTAADFVRKVTKASEARAQKDYDLLLARKRQDDPRAKSLERWDTNYYAELVRAESYAFDAKKLRPYFEFSKILDGLLSITGKLFGVTYREVKDAKSWHPSVLAYDVLERGTRIGRFYLDLHPRKDKYSHAAAAPLVPGIRGEQVPQAALMCNFPDPRGGHGPALMDFDEVDTFFHEFGHLLHDMFSGRGKWTNNTMGGVEWDFIEAPSQMLEEWLRDPKVLRTFARHVDTGEPVPREVVEAMDRADAVARALEAHRQLVYATLSLRYYDRDPTGIDSTQVLWEVHAQYPLVPLFEGTHLQCNFGHLNGYSAIYYTYLWSLVIAKDLFGRFKAAGSIMDAKVARAYRKEVLEPGGARPAAESIRAFLGRDFTFDAFERWLNAAGS